MKEKVIIFGASNLGEMAHNDLKDKYNIVYFCDNDQKKWGTTFCEILVISPRELVNNNLKVIICSTYYDEIRDQLEKMNITNYIVYCKNNDYIITEEQKQCISIDLAKKSKSIDRCAAQILFLFNKAKIDSIKGKVCMEIGAGFVLSHAIVMYLMGAKKVYVTDYNPLAYPKALKYALNSSEHSLIRDILSQFEDHQTIRERLELLNSVDEFSFEFLKSIGIEYVSPFDFSKGIFKEKVDFIYSLSVLEHFTINYIESNLLNLKNSLNFHGIMIHAVHLEDHSYFDKNKPFEFLKVDSSKYQEFESINRGNRLRKSQWEAIFKNLEFEYEFIYEFERKCRLPEKIDEQFMKLDNIYTSHFGVVIKNNIR
jgi:hypothetical protein